MSRRSASLALGLIGLGVVLWIGLAGAADDPIGAPVLAIEFECELPIYRRDLAALLPIPIGAPLQPDTIDVFKERLLRKQIFETVQVSAEPRDAGVALIVRLVRKRLVAAVRIRGAHVIGRDELDGRIRIPPGSIYSAPIVTAAAERVEKQYAKLGYSDVRVATATTIDDDGEIVVHFDITEGQPWIVAASVVQGNTGVPVATLERALTTPEGVPYTRALLRRGEKELRAVLRAAGYYGVSVKASWQQASDHHGVIYYQVDAGEPYTVSFIGNGEFKNKHLLKLMAMASRPFISDGTWRELGRRIRRAYQTKGYYRAEVGLKLRSTPEHREVDFEIVEGPLSTVEAIEFEGNTIIAPDTLRAQMATVTDRWLPWPRTGVLQDDVLKDDLNRLWFFYREQGFAAAEIVDVRPTFHDERHTLTLMIVVEQGPRSRVEAVEWRGAPEELTAAAVGPLQTTVGEPLNPDAVAADRRRLLRALARLGYRSAVVEPQVTNRPEADQVASEVAGQVASAVTFAIDPGLRQTVAEIDIKGNVETRDAVIAREIELQNGDPVDPDAMIATQRKVYQTGRFRTVSVREESAEKTQRDIAVEVTERQPGSIHWGAGYNTRDGFRGTGDIAYDNLGGMARRIGLRGEVAFDPSALKVDQYLANINYRDPRLGRTLWDWRSTVIFQRLVRDVNPYDLEQVAFINAVQRPLAPGLNAGFELVLDQSRAFNVEPDVILGPNDRGELLSVGLGPLLIYDGRDDPFAPTKGMLDSLSIRSTPSLLGSDVDQLRITAQHSQYIPVIAGLSFVYGAHVGFTRAFGGHDVPVLRQQRVRLTGSGVRALDTNEVPIVNRFFLGGRTTVRGFSENSIGPKGYLGHPVGGDLLVSLNAELRFPLVYNFGGAIFVDGGGLYLDNQDQCRAIGASGCAWSIDNFRRSAGPGLRYLTPVGPLSLDYGFKLDRRSGESIGEIHFSVGATF